MNHHQGFMARVLQNMKFLNRLSARWQWRETSSVRQIPPGHLSRVGTESLCHAMTTIMHGIFYSTFSELKHPRFRLPRGRTRFWGPPEVMLRDSDEYLKRGPSRKHNPFLRREATTRTASIWPGHLWRHKGHPLVSLPILVMCLLRCLLRQKKRFTLCRLACVWPFAGRRYPQEVFTFCRPRSP